MDNPDDNEEYKLEYQVFSSYEQDLEKHQACIQSRAEWDEKTKVYEDHKEREKMLAEYTDAEELEDARPHSLMDWFSPSPSGLDEGLTISH